MIPFIKGLYHDFDSRVLRMINILNSATYHPNIQKSFVPNTIGYLEDLRDVLQQKISSGDLDIESIAFNNMSEYNELNEFFQTIEAARFEVITKYNGPEIYFHHKIARIYDEIQHLSVPPLLATISNSDNYFWVHPVFEVIGLPFGEENNLLNLPDLYHEIGHLIFKQYPEIVKNEIWPAVEQYFHDQINQSYDEKTSDHYVPFFNSKRKRWDESWIEEFGCDMIGTYLCGPAFAYSNMKMAAINDGSKDVYSDSYSHPSDESRMRAVFFMLEKTGHKGASDQIKASWDDFINHTNYTKHPDYKYIYPDDLLRKLADVVYGYCQDIDLASYSDQVQKHTNPISKIVNDAWQEILSNPHTFERYQQEQIKKIQESFISD
ncbi:MAG TPA: hypothetical protein VIN08_01965 [Ohtaekwangia sp.]|uniref:hypothetical protein n=1 Tax=Ohtaekwangia sp. TaxID=2066019 RepID=UPI002F92AF39